MGGTAAIVIFVGKSNSKSQFRTNIVFTADNGVPDICYKLPYDFQSTDYGHNRIYDSYCPHLLIFQRNPVIE